MFVRMDMSLKYSQKRNFFHFFEQKRQNFQKQRGCCAPRAPPPPVFTPLLHQSTILRILKKRTTVEIYTRNTEMKTKKQHVQLNCWKLYTILKPHVQSILDDETYFSLTDDISCNRQILNN